MAKSEKRGQESQVPAGGTEDRKGGENPAVGGEESCKAEPELAAKQVQLVVEAASGKGSKSSEVTFQLLEIATICILTAIGEPNPECFLVLGCLSTQSDSTSAPV